MQDSFTRLFLADPKLKNQHGYHLSYNLLLANAAKITKRVAVLVTHRGFDYNLFEYYGRDRLGDIKPAFRNDWSATPLFFLKASSEQALGSIASKRFAEDLQKRMPPSELGPLDLILAQMLDPLHVACWIDWHATCHPSTAPSLILQLNRDAEQFHGHHAVHEAWERARAKGRTSRIHFISDNEILASEYREILDTEVRVLPLVVDARIQTVTSSVREFPLHLVFLGNARLEKGFVDLVDAIFLLDRELLGNRVKFTVQCYGPDRMCRDSIKKLSGHALSGIHLIRDSLWENEYHSILSSSDAMILPYHLHKYAKATSGVFCEALVSGKPVITTKDSWMGREIERTGGGWLVPERNHEELASAIHTAIIDGGHFAQGCRARASGYKDQFSADRFIRELEKIVISNASK